MVKPCPWVHDDNHVGASFTDNWPDDMLRWFNIRDPQARNYPGWYAIEYVWINWEHCNEVDYLSETILLRGVLEAAARAAA